MNNKNEYLLQLAPMMTNEIAAMRQEPEFPAEIITIAECALFAVKGRDREVTAKEAKLIAIIAAGIDKIVDTIDEFKLEDVNALELGIDSETIELVVGSLFGGKNLIPLSGDESEWIDISSKVGLPMDLPYRTLLGTDEPIMIQITKIEVNSRNCSVFRFNSDNRYAHAMGMLLGVDCEKHAIVLIDPNLQWSARYITFPYLPEYHYVQVKITDTSFELVDLEELDKAVFLAGSQVKSIPMPLHLLAEYRKVSEEEIARRGLEDCTFCIFDSAEKLDSYVSLIKTATAEANVEYKPNLNVVEDDSPSIETDIK